MRSAENWWLFREMSSSYFALDYGTELLPPLLCGFFWGVPSGICFRFQRVAWIESGFQVHASVYGIFHVKVDLATGRFQAELVVKSSWLQKPCAQAQLPPCFSPPCHQGKGRGGLFTGTGQVVDGLRIRCTAATFAWT